MCRYSILIPSYMCFPLMRDDIINRGSECMGFTQLFNVFTMFAGLGFAVSILYVIVILILHFVANKCTRKVPKQVPWMKVLFGFLVFQYAVVIIGATILFRGFGIFAHDPPILLPFYLYRSAIVSGDFVALMNLALNIAMFIPLGFLLPLAFDKLNKAWKLSIVVCVFSVSIETTQYFTGAGIFATDDIINNTLGGLIGYFLLAGFRSLFYITKQKLSLSARI